MLNMTTFGISALKGFDGCYKLQFFTPCAERIKGTNEGDILVKYSGMGVISGKGIYTPAMARQ